MKESFLSELLMDDPLGRQQQLMQNQSNQYIADNRQTNYNATESIVSGITDLAASKDTHQGGKLSDTQKAIIHESDTLKVDIISK